MGNGWSSKRESTPPRCPPAERTGARSEFRDGKLPSSSARRRWSSASTSPSSTSSTCATSHRRRRTTRNAVRRAGRSGQPALVFNYCAGGSSHDQYFFRRPRLMVAGQVQPPRLDLANEDLVRAHVHAVWLAETDLNLEPLSPTSSTSTATRLLRCERSVAGGDPAATSPGVAQREKARAAARRHPGIDARTGITTHWLDELLREPRPCASTGPATAGASCTAPHRRCARASTRSSQTTAGPRASATARSSFAHRPRRRSNCSAAADEREMQSDFYSYRYFASEGFLPGYSFPRLPLSAFIPAAAAPQAETSSCSGPASWRSPSSGRAASSTTRAPAT